MLLARVMEREVVLGFRNSAAWMPLVHFWVHQGVSQLWPPALFGHTHFCFIWSFSYYVKFEMECSTNYFGPKPFFNPIRRGERL